MTGIPWIIKYAPKTLTQVKGQPTDQLVLFLKARKKNALLIYGPTGTGKTCAVHALAKDQQLELLEVNASDVRNKDGIEQTVGQAVKQQSLFSKGKIILIDEIDGVSGDADRGGLPAIVDLISASTFPIILTANDIFDQKFSALRKHCMLLEFKALSPTTIAVILEGICQKEHISYEQGVLQQLARTCQGDLRAAINDLHVLAQDKKLNKDDLNLLGVRSKMTSMPEALAKVFKLPQPELVRMVYDSVDENIDKIQLWVDENLPKEYSGEALARGFAMLSRSDIFFKRVRRRQHYRFYVYCTEALSTGIALAKTEKNPAFVSYTPTSRILKMWIANQKNAKREALAEKFSGKLRLSKKKMRQELPYLKRFFRNAGTQVMGSIGEQFELSAEEIAWLKE